LIKKNKKIKFTIIIGFILLIPIHSSILYSFTPLLVSQKDVYDLKSSIAYYNIAIDDLPGSLTNWLWAEAQPWFGGGSGSEQDPYILEDLIVDGNLTDSCISISNSKAYFIIQKCTLLNSSSGATDGGISLNNVTNGKIIGNYFNNHRNAAIYCILSDYNIVSENTLINHRHGIYIMGNFNEISGNSIYGDGSGSGIVIQGSYHDNLIDGNSIEHCWQGIFLFNADNNTFSRNTSFKNLQYGIGLTAGANDNFFSDNILLNNSLSGIRIDNSNDNTIVGTKAISNQEHGISLTDGDDTIIYHNRLIDNVFDGVHLDSSSSHNLIYHNFFKGNGRHAYDDGAFNDWNSTTMGNYWDNHTGPDISPTDGIVDTPYLFIGGGAGSIDYLPLTEDGPPVIIINSPLEDDTFGTNAPSFSVTITDTFLEEMWYSLDGGITKFFFTANGTIDQAVWNGLPEGSITITFYANDTIGNISSESVNIVKEIPDNSLVIIIVVISIIAGVALVAIVLLLRRRKAIQE